MGAPNETHNKNERKMPANSDFPEVRQHREAHLSVGVLVPTRWVSGIGTWDVCQHDFSSTGGWRAPLEVVECGGQDLDLSQMA